MATSTVNTNKPILPRGADVRPIDSYNRAALYSGKALSFDGVNDYVDLDGFTMAGNVATIVFQAKFETDQYLLDIDTQRFVIRNTSSEGFRVFNSDSFAEYGETKRSELGFYSIVSDGTTQRAYYNGVQLGSDKTIIALDWSSATNVKIASNNTGTNNFFNGQIAGFKIFNTALTAAQVADLYNNPEKIVPTGVDNTALKLWLPMMESAGTTAYDGSGNGNHGTINGATYVNGIGAAVAQTSVIDWNKGRNYVNEYSEDFSDVGWQKVGSSISASSETNPYGKQTWEFEVTSLPSEVQVRGNLSITYATAFKHFVIAKAGTLNWLRIRNVFVAGGSTEGNVWFNLSTGIVGTEQSSQTGTMTDLGDGWYKCEVSGTSDNPIVNNLFDIGFTDTDGTLEPSATGGTGFLVLSSISLNGIYVETLGTSQTTPVLLPAGLTTGRDITGVNLFENVRKQGALNLDGSSWAEVHDNASLDMTDAISAECWVYWRQTTASNDSGLLSRWDGATGRQFLIYHNTTTSVQFYIDNFNSQYQSMTEGWHHIVGTYDKVNRKIYVDGVLRDTDAQTTSIPSSDDKIEIGSYAHIASKSTEDTIAQPRIYNRALTAEEVLKNYNATSSLYI